jgi:hypothetical protein
MAPIRFGVMLVLSVAGNTGCLKATPAMHDASSLPDPKSSKSGSGARDAVDSTPGPANPGTGAEGGPGSLGDGIGAGSGTGTGSPPGSSGSASAPGAGNGSGTGTGSH